MKYAYLKIKHILHKYAQPLKFNIIIIVFQILHLLLVSALMGQHQMGSIHSSIFQVMSKISRMLAGMIMIFQIAQLIKPLLRFLAAIL